MQQILFLFLTQGVLNFRLNCYPKEPDQHGAESRFLFVFIVFEGFFPSWICICYGVSLSGHLFFLIECQRGQAGEHRGGEAAGGGVGRWKEQGQSWSASELVFNS